MAFDRRETMDGKLKPVSRAGTENESIETREWFESLDYVLQTSGPARAGRLLE